MLQHREPGEYIQALPANIVAEDLVSPPIQDAKTVSIRPRFSVKQFFGVALCLAVITVSIQWFSETNFRSETPLKIAIGYFVVLGIVSFLWSYRCRGLLGIFTTLFFAFEGTVISCLIAYLSSGIETELDEFFIGFWFFCMPAIASGFLGFVVREAWDKIRNWKRSH